MRLTLPLLFLAAGSLVGCVDPVGLLGAAVAPSDAEIKAEHDAYMTQAFLNDFRASSCPELTRLWPEVKAAFLNDPSKQTYIAARDQVIAEKGCVVPAPTATSSDQPATSTTASKPAATPAAPAPISPSVAPVSRGALSTSTAEYTARETPERYRNRSCDYLHARLRETQPGLSSQDPEVRQWSQKAKSVISEVLVENSCGPATWIGGRVGAVIATIDPVKASRLEIPKQGVWVETIVPGGSAERAGLLRGDVIVAVNDVPVADASEFFVIVLRQPVGSTIRVKFWRVRSFVELPVVVAAAPAGQ